MYSIVPTIQYYFTHNFINHNIIIACPKSTIVRLDLMVDYRLVGDIIMV